MATDFAAMARLLANPARSAVVDVLMEGRPLAAGELAQVAGVQPSTISEHLSTLVDGGLLTVVSAGRHRYYRLAGTDVATALEAFSRICPTVPVRSLRQSLRDRQLRMARLCYDHLAGALGVALLDRMCSSGWLISDRTVPNVRDFQVTESGATVLTDLGVNLEDCAKSRRHFARSCLDWSERREHLAGALGAAVAATLLDRGWLQATRPGRGVQITDRGERDLHRVLGINVVGDGR